MRITPMDIRQQQFTVRMFRGFDAQEVDTFLEDLADDYETLLKENSSSRSSSRPPEERQRGVERARAQCSRRRSSPRQRMVEEMKESGPARGGADRARGRAAGREGVEAARTRGSQAPRARSARSGDCGGRLAEELALHARHATSGCSTQELEDDPGEPA